MLWLIPNLIFAVIPPQQALDELVLGEWKIQSTTFSPKQPTNTNIQFYSTFISELDNPRNFGGDIIINETNHVEKLGSIRLDFDQESFSSILVYFNEKNPITELNATLSQNNLITASGRLQIGNSTYFLSVLSYKAAELTLYDHEKQTVTIYRMYKTVVEPTSGSSDFLFTSLSSLMVLYFFINRNRGKNNNANENTNENVNTNQNENENDDETDDGDIIIVCEDENASDVNEGKENDKHIKTE
ncbi:hypothetical protein TRFO_10860 [Tritrichomonas foetus]|uniref:Lipocalin-like domain-containing protein n=1 Tax=Tritrichomonas foetus TaxID=1144522 RepID=A0A1J4J6P8_9EUKA|nr:hypothetical protein TRFO_10860 [Tritrichomonas foetus]|eukprot:OHS94910.1 hypothetical protein TRFO_10860 [Tritrichomonas foetus]